MKIERITLIHLRMPLQSHFETSFGRIYDRDCILLVVYSEGLVGYGECVADRDPGYAYETTGTAWHIYHDFIIPRVIGQDIQDPADLQERLSPIKGHQMAKAGLELAVWDLLGKRAGRSVANLIGGVKPRVPVGVSVGIQDTTNDLLRTVDGYLDDGYGRVKLKIKPGRDVQEVRAVREVYPDLNLQVDANSAYSLESAQALMPLDELNLLLIEQPLSEDDLWYHRILQSRFTTALCLDESITTPRHARQALEMGSCRIINIKPGRVGGISQGLKIHDICQDRGVPVWCGGMLETGIGRAGNLAMASLPNFSLPGDISATDRYYTRDITNERFSLNADSTIDVPTGVGLGVTINQEAVDCYTLRSSSYPPLISRK
jgi:O-succinylbenzoate synthase